VSCGGTRSESLSNETRSPNATSSSAWPGYPATPDHTVKRTLFSILGAEEQAGIHLTESFAMLPTASVSGLYLWHPESHYFGLGRIGRDQLEDYARRTGLAVDEAARWLSPNLGD